jgi:predicted RNase H-like HicB family nuclease
MEQAVEQYAIPLTFLFKCERGMWTALACEVDIAACGCSIDEAREALKEAVEIYVVSMFECGRRADIARPISQDDLQELLQDPPPDKQIRREDHTMIVAIHPPSQPTIQYIPALLAQTNCGSLEAQVH